MPYALTDRQKEYLEFIREYIRENESSPRLEEIADHFGVTLPTAHKTLEALHEKGYLYFARDPKVGFFIRLIERAGSAEAVMEVPITGKIGEYGKVYEFPQMHGHFASVIPGAAPDEVFALVAMTDIPQASILMGDRIIFDLKKKPQQGDICLAPIGENLFLIKIASKTIDKMIHAYETTIWYPIPGNMTDPEVDQLFNWYPLAYDDDTDPWFTKLADEQNWPRAPIPAGYIVGTALRLSRMLAF